MSNEEMILTIQRDVAAVAAQIDIVKQFCRSGRPDAAWYHADLAEARLQGLSGFIGLQQPWDQAMVETIRAAAAASILPHNR